MIKKIIAMAMLMSLVGMAQGNDSNAIDHTQGGMNRETPRRIKMSQSVYATTAPEAVQRVSPGEMNPEQRRKLDQNKRRRFEIMMLLGSYKLMPENQRAPIKAELLKRIEADFQAMIIQQKERIAQAELDLKRFRAELADRESRREELVKREFERLLNMPIPGERRSAPTVKAVEKNAD